MKKMSPQVKSKMEVYVPTKKPKHPALMLEKAREDPDGRCITGPMDGKNIEQILFKCYNIETSNQV